ncbi:PepSY-associated TM helix domain-containing protein [Flagellimonas onchidii]|uniref:PepSY-associated TM helix domain-containing protein n=1 Tax=Flagellimonas onchidii TaxID=2562684 RepID=UPI0010A698D3|nr:PepSY-associated TM helix domain-containing protein [Allomuricauda onchidii]
MNKRTYNILFHTHTVSGIVISVALYVIFFAGSFAFFRDEINSWQHNHKVTTIDELPADLDVHLKQLSKEYNLFGRDIELRHNYNERNIGVSLGASKDSLATEKDKETAFLHLDTENGQTSTYTESYALGEFLYRLHFFAQIPYPVGYYLSGFVALFFLFAIITGIIVHWNKIVSNFYVFRPWAKIKTLWTDAHTALGVIGLPFQFVYAVTGAFFMIKGLLVIPLLLGIYDGDQTKLYEDLEYTHPEFEFHQSELKSDLSIDQFVEDTKTQWPDFKITEAHIFNYGDDNMHVALSGNMAYDSKFNGIGYRIYKIIDGSIYEEKNPTLSTSYLDGVKNMMFRLHFGDYAGYGLRVISFVLGLISCLVILSGIMIWLTARNKNHIPEKQRRFNQKVANIYMAICLSMFPVTAIEFIIVKFFPLANMTFIYRTYFVLWLLASIFFILKKNIQFTNKWTLISGGMLALSIPFVNGAVSGKWFWLIHENGYRQMFVIDMLWLVLGLISLWVVFFKLGKGKIQPISG